ncbi:hypothetical protein B0T25DRAFT_100509 [Lasiosphaeria hispida]|uniref:Peptidase S8/S53 domain-containing protein n=1 Tax=Lasiosphaeria hispida TaxID=260671 RepID=A0AAJ0MHP8_9PEZI|nr:hypothetical protein B0T25DRAFT_100509 [Lasiosphaeria hispida]
MVTGNFAPSPFEDGDDSQDFAPVQATRTGTWPVGFSDDFDQPNGEYQYGDDNEDDYGFYDSEIPEDHAQQLEADPPMPAPPDDPEYEMRRARMHLIGVISEDRDTDWANEATWEDQNGYANYKTQVNSLLQQERSFLAGTQSDQSPTNFLQHVLEKAVAFYPPQHRLHKAKFLLQLITQLDPAQLSPRWGPKPLHAAAAFDIKLLGEDRLVKDDKTSSPDLTLYMCNLMKEKAAEEICEVNNTTENQNILHLAILHDLKGVEELILKAAKPAFRKQRTSLMPDGKRKLDDLNTPLHDALDFTTFLLPEPACQIPRPALANNRANSSPAQGGRRPSLVPRTSTNTPPALPTTSLAVQKAPNQQQPVASNQARSRGNATTPLQSVHTARKSGSGVCQVCRAAHEARLAAEQRRRKIINLLIKRDKDVLSMHNSAGLSPYLFLLAAQQKHVNAQQSQEEPPPANKETPPSTPGTKQTQSIPLQKGAHSGVTADGRVPARSTGPQLSDAAREEKEKEARFITLEEEEAIKKLKLKQEVQKRADIIASDRTDGVSPTIDGRSGARNPGAAKASVKNSTPKPASHFAKDLVLTDIGSYDILPKLRGFSFELGGYKKACDCLFRDQNAKGASPFDGELDRQRRFSLEGNQRVKSSTPQNFDFLIFEPTMASVVLSLEYTLEDIKTMPSSEEERVDMWRQDEENLKAVFSWLKEDKKVETILNLTVKDNPHHYCSDDTVEECLKGLDVMYLNWNKPDMCVHKDTLPATLVEISLHWTGLNSVLWSWSGTEGLRTLTKLQKVFLYIQRGAELPKKQDAKFEAFKKRVEAWTNPDAVQLPLAKTAAGGKPAAPAKPVPGKRLIIIKCEDDRRFGGGSKGGGLNSKNIPTHSWFQTASEFSGQFLSAYRDMVYKESAGRRYHIKVALLDDGVDPTYDHNGTNLHHTGWPSVDSGEPEQGARSFYVSTNQHGSKMAWLIRQVCPFVTIYVAKLDVKSGESVRQRTFSLEQATKAIEWATAQKVDVISMSWSAREITGKTGNEREVRALENAIEAAATENILMFAAACDVKQSASTDKWIPCDHQRVFSIGATDLDFDVKKYVDMSKKVDYLFPGEYILNKLEDAEVGNSGATALATGLAALVMSCMRIDGRATPRENRMRWMSNIMSKTFNSAMNGKVVHIKDVLRLDAGQGSQTLGTKFASQEP